MTRILVSLQKTLQLIIWNNQNIFELIITGNSLFVLIMDNAAVICVWMLAVVSLLLRIRLDQLWWGHRFMSGIFYSEFLPACVRVWSHHIINEPILSPLCWVADGQGARPRRASTHSSDNGYTSSGSACPSRSSPSTSASFTGAICLLTLAFTALLLNGAVCLPEWEVLTAQLGHYCVPVPRVHHHGYQFGPRGKVASMALRP